MKKREQIAGLLAAVMLAAAIPFSVAEAAAQQENIVVMIDPGHGGSNLGGQVPGLDEKNATLITAFAMKEELEKYDGITVLLTREDDRDLGLSERAQMAADAGARFLFSLHYNKAVPNRLYGAEIWIPSLGDNYSEGYACGDLILNELCDRYGLYRRGVKTKLNTGGTDYYGVIRHASALGVPSMIIEHCHLDNPVDTPYCDSIERLQTFGRLDATGVAKYFHLRSDELGVDYSDVSVTRIAPPQTPVMQDVTPPDAVSIRSAKRQNGQIAAVIESSDAQSCLLYYDYSLDGGATWSSLQKWESADGRCAVAIPGDGAFLTVRVYNQYDLATQSDTVRL